MTNMTFDTEKKHNRKRAVRIYCTLVVCMLAFTAVTWALVRSDRSSDSAQKRTTATAAQAGAAKTNVRKTTAATTRTVPTTTVEPTTTEKKTQNTVANFFVMPVGGIMTKMFNDEQLQYDETYNDWRLHRALDIAADKGTEVHAAGDGKVSKVYEDSLLGNVVVVDHGNGIIAHYCGLDKARVSEGEAVAAGAVLGGVGTVPCEGVEQAHVHFAVQKDGAWIDPIEGLGIGIE